MAELTAGELRRRLADAGLHWDVNERLRDDQPIPRPALGLPYGEQPPLAKDIGKIDLHAVVSQLVPNSLVNRRRAQLGHLTLDDHPPQGGVGTRASTVDWRQRWGWPWITTIKNQNPCGSCWAFGSTGVVESMARIEHAVWALRSEGDVHDGIGSTCGAGNWPGTALDWMRDHGGSCDAGCWAYHTPPAGTADPDNWRANYQPTSDRSGRTVRISSWTQLGDVEQQKQWIDAVGPLAACFDVYQDFFALGTGVYRKGPDPNPYQGGHCVLVVGYDDAAGCWIFKNSWGTGYHDHGFGRIAYGECNFDYYAKCGLQGANADPWSKRRLHGGNLLESGNGAARRNFEMLATAGGGQVRAWWREGSGTMAWGQAAVFGNDAAVCPTFTSTTFNRNLEAVWLTTGQRLHHWWFDQGAHQWKDGGVFGPADAAGIPAFIQGDYGAPGNFEVVVRTADSRLNHWWRDGGGWHDGGRFASNIAYSGAAMVQTRGRTLDVVAVRNDGAMQRLWRDDPHGFVWNAGEVFGTGISSPPCMIEGQYGARDENTPGNYELCVAIGGHVEHWWRANTGDGGWRRSATFGHNVRAVAGLVEGSFGFNLEVVVLRDDNQLQHYWRDGAGWHEGVVIGAA